MRVTIDGRRLTRTTNTLTKARSLRTELELSTPSGPGTLTQLLDRWIATKLGTIADSTMTGYESVIRLHIKPNIGDRQVGDIKAADIESFYSDLAATGVTAHPIRLAHMVLSQAFKTSVRWRQIPHSPTSTVDPPLVTSREISPPTAGHITTLIQAAGDYHPGFGCYIRLSVVTGARRGELVALRGDDIDLETGELLIRRALVRAGPDLERHQGAPVPGHRRVVEKETKTRTARRIALDAATVKALRDHRRMLAERALSVGVSFDLEQHRWFTDDPAGVIPWPPNRPTRMWARTRASVGLEHVRLHDLRHFTATQALAAGVDVRTVAGRLGHSRASMTLDRYSHVIPAADRAAADILGDIVSG